MTIESVTYNYRSEKIPDIIKDYRKIKENLGIDKTNKNVEAEPPWWSGNLGEEIKEKDYLCAKALTSLAILNGPTDIDEFLSAWKEIKSKFREKKPDGYNPKEAQHPFSFFRGTVLHEYLNPNSDKCISKKLAKYIIKNDVSLRDTKFGEWILDKLGVKEVGRTTSKVESLQHTFENPDFVHAKIYKSPNVFGDITARALTRTSKYGAYTLAGLGGLHAAHEIAEGENPAKQLRKTALQVTTTLASVGYLGALGYKHHGALGSLLGMGLGTAIGASVPELFEPVKPSSETF